MAKQQFPDLKTWLESIGLSKYGQVLEREEITLDVLGYLTETDLERIGLPLGPRKKILHEIVLLDPTTPPASKEGISEEARRKFEDARHRADERAKRESELIRREEEFTKREAEAEAKRAAEAKALAEADRRRDAEAKARAAAEERARLAAIEKAKTEAQAALAKREAELQKREAEAKARAEAEARARRELEEKTKKEAELRANVEAEERARQEAEDKAKRQAEARAKAEAEAREKKAIEEHTKREAEFAKREAEAATLEAELRRRLAESPKARFPVVQTIVGLMVVLALAFGVNYWKKSRDEAHLAELTATLDAATRASQELDLARQRQEELIKRVEVARLAEEDARAKGDQAKLKELQEQTKKAEAEAQKQNELVKQREAVAKKADEAAKLTEARKQTDTAKAAEKVEQEKASQIKATEQAAAEKKAAEQAAEMAATERAAGERRAAEKAAAEKIAAEKRTAERQVAQKSSGLDDLRGKAFFGFGLASDQTSAEMEIKFEDLKPKVTNLTISGLTGSFYFYCNDASIGAHLEFRANCNSTRGAAVAKDREVRGVFPRLIASGGYTFNQVMLVFIESSQKRSFDLERAKDATLTTAKFMEKRAASLNLQRSAENISLPSVGDRWIYEAREKDHPEKKSEITVEVKAVTSSSVRDTYKIAGGPEVETIHRPGAYAVGMGDITSFSPYLRAFQQGRQGERWSDVEFRDVTYCPVGMCFLSARVDRRENVTVRAGTYAATVIVLESRRTGEVKVTKEHTYWYADGAKRFVKYQSRFKSGLTGYGPPDIDLELVSYTPAGGH